jgi:hypothetical protein
MFMEVSLLRNSGFDGVNVRRPECGHAGLRKILYRGLWVAAILAAVFDGGFSAAQQETPQITPLDKKVRKRSDKDPRALALLLMTQAGKVTLLPIAIRVNGKFYDAQAYKAAPVPMALESGTVYEAARTGNSLGLFTVSSALHSTAENAAVPWIGTGIWLPAGASAPKTGIKAEDVPVGMETKDEPPRLTKTAPKSGPAAGSAAPTGPASASAPPSTTPSAAPSGSSQPASVPPPAPASGTTPAASTPTGPSQPPPGATITLPAGGTRPRDPASAPASDSAGNREDNRPRLRRGAPTEPLPADDDVPGYAKPNSGHDKTAAATGAKVADPAAKRIVEYVPAISDAGDPGPRPYVFDWLKGEEEERRKQMEAAAREQVRLYVDMRARGKIVATAPGTKVPLSKKLPKASEPILENVQMRTFDVWGNNQPVMILSADAHLPVTTAKAAVGAAPQPDSSLQYSIMLVARTDIYNNLHKLYSGVTDKFHLDVTPHLDLIDAVDADGDGRGELLFRKTSDLGSGYVVYRPTADTLWTMFDTLNPE